MRDLPDQRNERDFGIYQVRRLFPFHEDVDVIHHMLNILGCWNLR